MKNSTALLIIDMQEGFITKETQHVADNINNMLKNNTRDKKYSLVRQYDNISSSMTKGKTCYKQYGRNLKMILLVMV